MDPVKKLKVIILFSIALIITGIFVSAFGRADELHNYKVYGQNKETGLMVAGHIREVDEERNLAAKIYDKMEIVDQCSGQWVGYGVAEVKCENGHTYVVEVIED